MDDYKSLKDKFVSFKNAAEQNGFPLRSNDDLLTLDVDILVPAALEDMINKKNMRNIKAKAIIETANGPTTNEAENYLSKIGVDVIPDILGSAGGVITSYFEWYQNMHEESWTEEKVFAELTRYMQNAFDNVYQVKQEKNLTYRQAAFYISVKRIIQ